MEITSGTATLLPIDERNKQNSMYKNILLADDHPIVRDGLKQLIESEMDLKVIAQAATSAEALRFLANDDHYDLVILDIALPDRSGVDTLHLIRDRFQNLPVLIMSGYPEAQYAVNLLRAGANGYLRKDAESTEIIRAIRTALVGRKYISDQVAELLTDTKAQHEKGALHQGLSQREFQVLCRLAAGQSATEIANELFISIKSVSTYRTRLLEKLNLKSNAELIHYAVKNKLIE